MKRAQVSHIIAYLLAIVIFGMVLVFGYKAIANIRQQTDQAAYLGFQKSLESDIKSIYFDYGSVKKLSYSIRGYEWVCFADLKYDIVTAINTNPVNPIVLNSIQSEFKKNIFLVNDKVDSFYVEKIILTEDEAIPPDLNPLCIPIVNGKLSIKLTGQGDYALVEKQPQP